MWTVLQKSLEKPSLYPIRANTQCESDTNRRFSGHKAFIQYVVQSVTYWVQIHPGPRDNSKELVLLASKNRPVWGKTDTRKQMVAQKPWHEVFMSTSKLSNSSVPQKSSIWIKRKSEGDETKQKRKSVWRGMNWVWGLRYIMTPKSNCPGAFDSFQHFPAFISSYWWNPLQLWGNKVIREGQEKKSRSTFILY